MAYCKRGICNGTFCKNFLVNLTRFLGLSEIFEEVGTLEFFPGHTSNIDRGLIHVCYFTICVYGNPGVKTCLDQAQ